MYRPFSILLLAVSLSAVVLGYSGNSEYAVLKGKRDGSTHEFDSHEQEFYETRAKNCTKPGPMCDGCDTLYTCIQIGTIFIKEKLEDCAPGTCLEYAATCTTGPNQACDENVVGFDFTCHQTGVFPDPFDCQKYHLCYPNGSEEVGKRSLVKTCSGSYYYDTKTTLCRKKLVNNGCPIVVQPCTTVGESGVIPGNPALYYICLRGENVTVSFPNLFICPDGEEFDTESKICMDASPPPAAGPDGKCLKVGNFYDPVSCMYYYECTAVAATPVRRVCNTKMHFDHRLKNCVDYTCNDLGY